jgi:hypothetical protein
MISTEGKFSILNFGNPSVGDFSINGASDGVSRSQN